MFVTVSHSIRIIKLMKCGLEGEIRVVGKLDGQAGQNSCKEPSWRLISSVVSLGLILEQTLFNVFLSYMDDRIECMLSKFMVADCRRQSCTGTIHAFSYTEA